MPCAPTRKQVPPLSATRPSLVLCLRTLCACLRVIATALDRLIVRIPPLRILLAFIQKQVHLSVQQVAGDRFCRNTTWRALNRRVVFRQGYSGTWTSESPSRCIDINKHLKLNMKSFVCLQ